jgi:drug/metabolite transporter (DMT)-like permease
MIGDAVLYAASRATSSAVESVTRRVTWVSIAAVFILAAFVFALTLAFWFLQDRLGSLQAAGIIAAVCAVVGLVCLSMPTLIERVQRARHRQESPVSTAVAAVDEEAKEAVDYFGALRVVGAAFLFGMGAARRLKR